MMDHMKNYSEELDDEIEELPPTPFELAEQRHAIVRVQEEKRYRRSVRAANRSADLPEPKPGDKLWISSIRDIPQRRRAGLLFTRDQRTEVRVVDELDDAIVKMQREGALVVNPWGAELILADSSLQIYRSSSAADGEARDLRAQLDSLREENRRANDELAALRMAARRAAPESPDGRPSKLIATRDMETQVGSDTEVRDTDAPAASLLDDTQPAPAPAPAPAGAPRRRP